MDHYLDLRVLPDPEFPASQLMSALFMKLHRVLARTSAGNIGVSFPAVNEDAPHLGNTLRLHGTAQAFELLMREPWLTGMRDHISIGGVAAVPSNVAYRRVRRVQAKSNVERVRRRQMKRHGWSDAEARERIPRTAERTLSLPYLQLYSESTGHKFPLFLRHEAAESSTPGVFNAYGLSDTATLPWF
ncbi:MAG: type I-F CRISPR-associated endoribonuclease Cas6/Csy4 [Polyangiaceae bacterium]|nr:type I-F CRISPR-associated endoribonuclease Cas6/Csy4 [Polyangiaceae bacterium]